MMMLINPRRDAVVELIDRAGEKKGAPKGSKLA